VLGIAFSLKWEINLFLNQTIPNVASDKS